ncbi:uncharacterized protein LOC115073368 [Rhinatrema bivittatum]|uniref:uncharacterized protein LOC115073368 n=1 Tax=Rhinatrema bivittatum TaxID=194408 RepID=UPI00112EE1A8|nr:uncharacterized protein LOC115073368 [Rhinatrema bivittatum]
MGSLSPTDPQRWIFLTALCLWTCEPGEGKVYISCGAVLNSMERGLILSPGFPNSYHPRTHCVWQFFVPAGYQLVMEIFDFDVFENTSDKDSTDSYSSSFKRDSTNMPFTEESSFSDLHSLPTVQPVLQARSLKALYNHSKASPSKSLEGFQDGAFHNTKIPDEAKQTNEQKRFQRENSAKDLPDEKMSTEEASPAAPANYATPRQDISGQDIGQDLIGKSKFAHLPGRKKRWNKANAYLHEPTTSKGVTESVVAFLRDSSSTPPLPVDMCPHDVLYISDLITFSSRFCGTNLPLNKTMVFGSSVGLVEVIMELITTTDRGRGFVMLFEYKNDTDIPTTDLQRHGENITTLAVSAGTIFFALLLLTILCMVYRQKMCSKRQTSAFSEQENGIQNAAVDISELRLVVPSWESETDRSPDPAGCAGVQERAPSHQPHKEDPSFASAVSASGSDEVFVVLSGEGASELSFTSHRLQDKNLKRSVTSPASVSEWLAEGHMTPDEAAADKGNERIAPNHPRQRTWSVRTFHDLLPPLPQLQRKRCSSWTMNSPFIKLVDSGTSMDAKNLNGEQHRPSRSAMQIEAAASDSNASGQLFQSAPRQPGLGSCQLKRSRFGSPYFGCLTNSNHAADRQSTGVGSYHPQNQNLGPDNTMEASKPYISNSANSSRSKELTVEMEKLKPVFVISEEGDDQLPLVLAEQLSQAGECLPAEQDNIHGPVKATATTQQSLQGFCTRSPTAQRLQYHIHAQALQSPRNLSSPSARDSSQARSPLNIHSPFPKLCPVSAAGALTSTSREPCEHV